MAVEASLRLARSARSSWPILPVQMTTRLASSRLRSGSTFQKRGRESSSSGAEAALWRSMLLGVKTISGLRQLRSAWRRSRWKCWQAVEGWATWMASSAASCRKRSILALECSGP